MIVNGKINRMIRSDKFAVVEFEIPLHHANRIDELDKEEQYSLNIQKASKRKTLNQNKTAWMLMTDIAKKEDVLPDPEAVYLMLLKMSKIGTMHLVITDIEFISEKEKEKGKTELTDEELIKKLKTVYRVVIIHERRKNRKGYSVSMVEVALGMSSFNREKMTTFIKQLLYYAEQVEIDTSQYRFID